MRGPAVARGLCVCLLSIFAIPTTGAQERGNTPENNNPLPTITPGKPSPSSAGQNESLPTPLTVEEAVRIGLERNPRATAAQAGVAAAAANYRALSSFPNLDLGVTRTQGTSTAPGLLGTTDDTFLDVTGTLDTSGQRRFQAAGARALTGVARYQFEETRLTLAQQIRDAYWSLVAARAQTQIAQQGLQDVQRILQLTQTQEQAGDAPHVDVIRASIDVANSQQSYIAAESAERSALAALNTLLSRSPFAPVQPADNLAATTAVPALLTDLPELPTLTRLALANRPLVQAAREQVRAADYARKQADAARRPDLSVDYQESLQQTDIYAVLLSVRLPLFDFGSIRHSIQAAQQSQRQAEAQAQQTEEEVTQAVAQAYTDFTQARTQAASYRTDILTPSETLLDLAQLGYQQGATGILPVIDAAATLRAARTGYINSLLALYKGRDAILAAVGSLSPASLKEERPLPQF